MLRPRSDGSYPDFYVQAVRYGDFDGDGAVDVLQIWRNPQSPFGTVTTVHRFDRDVPTSEIDSAERIRFYRPIPR